ncbi:unnamed protein product [Lactuca saligna]|uniref:DUF674 family protein n=1 Tax=Lactuca saligna TaxID=75948 RepID=A0AA35YE74_LACSI|nr:unnamed protein product [Lactuca saligna]
MGKSSSQQIPLLDIKILYAPSMASPNMTLKLLVDKKAQKVLFAEATKDFVDFLFHIFSLPLGSLIQFLGSKQMVGCLGDLKESLLRRIMHQKHFTGVVIQKTVMMSGGYVKDVVTYMVMDNLVVKPMSTISSITLINSFGVKDLSQLEEKTLPFGKDEALKLLKASLMTKQVLTTLFQRDAEIFYLGYIAVLKMHQKIQILNI